MSENIVIRHYQENDWDDVYSILQEGYESKIAKNVFEEHYIGPKKNVLVANDQEESRVVGCICWEIKEDFIRTQKTLYLTYLVVTNAYRRQGIARRLYEELERLATKFECSSIEFTSANFRKNAHALYKSMGYTIKDTSVFIKELM